MALALRGSERPLAEVANDLSEGSRGKCLVALSELRRAGDAGAPYYDKVLSLATGKDAPLDVKSSAYEALAACAKGHEKEVTAKMLEGLESGTAELRSAGATGLGILKVASAADKLGGLLQDSHMRVRCAAAGALALVGESSASQAKVLATQLKVPIVRKDAICALGSCGKAGAEYLEEIAGFLEDSDSNVRLAVGEAFSGLQQWVPQSVEEKLATALDHQSDPYRATAAMAVGGLGAKAAKYVPALVKMMRECPPPGARLELLPNCAAALALGKLGAKDDDIAFYLKSKTPSMRIAACEGLASMGTAAAKHKPAIQALLKDEYESVREVATRVLGSV